MTTVPAAAEVLSAMAVPLPSVLTLTLYSVVAGGGVASFSNIALTSTFPAGMVNLLSLIVTPPVTTCHCLKVYPASAFAVRVISVPAAAVASDAEAVPPLSALTVTLYSVVAEPLTNFVSPQPTRRQV